MDFHRAYGLREAIDVRNTSTALRASGMPEMVIGATTTAFRPVIELADRCHAADPNIADFGGPEWVTLTVSVGATTSTT